MELIAPWAKSARGRFVDHPDIVVLPEIKRYIGKVVYVLDDFVTTGKTLQTATMALTGLEIHCHAVAYMFWS